MPAIGEQVTLHTHLIVRDDALTLYGFATRAGARSVPDAAGVQSVGPKVALAVLSGGRAAGADRARSRRGDAARFQAVPGIGKRTAERIIVELREKVGVRDRSPLARAARRRSSRGAAIGRPAHARARRPARARLRPAEAEELLAGAEGETAEELIGARACALGDVRRWPMTDTAAPRIQTPHLVADDELDRSLRPRRLEEFVGQEALRDQLAVSIEAAARRGEALDHVLLAGPPGLGKTSLAQIVAAELDVPFVQTAGPALERKGDIAGVPDRARAARRVLRR